MEAGMSAFEKIAFNLGIRNEHPNQELAKELAKAKDSAGIAEIAANLTNRNKSIASDCIKVLYEIGYIDPTLLIPYVDTFLALLDSKVNRMVWGAMIGLSTVAELAADKVFLRAKQIMTLVDEGTVITRVAGLKTLTRIAATGKKYYDSIFPFLVDSIKAGRTVDIPGQMEEYARILTPSNAPEIVRALADNGATFKTAQLTRINKVLKQFGTAFKP